MAYSSWVDTSLDLNLNPLRYVNDVIPPKEVESKSLHFERKISVKDESYALEEELKRVNEENKRLTEMLTVMCEKYNALRNHLMNYMNKNPEQKELIVSSAKKRKSESSNNDSISNHVVGIINSNGNSENSSTDQEDTCKKLQREESIKAKITRAYVRIEPSDTTLVVKDGYQWRKYGQKVTRDNPCPRAYFKCSFAPSCPVKRKVQKSVEDQCVLVATYEGEHNHPPPSQLDHQANTSSTRSSTTTLSGSINPFSTSVNGGSSTPSNITLDLIKSKSNPSVENTPEVHKFLVEQMASSLTKDSKFTAALAAAISGRIFTQ